MTFANSHMDKIINPCLAMAALHSAEPYGEFKAYIKLAATEFFPASLKEAHLWAPGVLSARIPCNQIENVAADTNVISIELRERVAY